MSKYLDVVFIADPHINGYSFLDAYVEDTDSFIYSAMQSVANYCTSNGIKHLVILGDIFDNPNPSQNDQKRLLRFLKNLDIHVYLIFGNHDYSNYGVHSLILSDFFAEEATDKIHVYTKPTLISIDGIPFSMLPWPNNKSLTKGPCINCAHITTKGSRSDTGRIMSKGETIKIKDNQYWMIGDLHTRQKYYPGTLLQKSFGESLPKGFSHLTIKLKDNKLLVKEDWVVRKPEYELVNLRVDSLEDLEKIESYNTSDLKLYVLKVAKDVVLPSTYKETYSNVHHVRYDGKERVVENKTGKIIDISGVVDPLKGIRSFMKREGLSSSEIKQGYKYLQDKLKRMEGTDGL